MPLTGSVLFEVTVLYGWVVAMVSITTDPDVVCVVKPLEPGGNVVETVEVLYP